MFCAIGGHVPEHPVVSKRTGTVYERALIEKWIEKNGTRDPITGETLLKDDLLPVHGGPAANTPGNMRLRAFARSHSDDAAATAQAGAPATISALSAMTTAASSVPGLLTLLNTEWEALLLEQYTLRQQLATTQQELALALYKHDAACRVIARLVGERDAALRAAGQPVPAAPELPGVAAGGDAAEGDAEEGDAGLPDAICDALDAHAAKAKAAMRAAAADGSARAAVPAAAEIAALAEGANLKPPHAPGVRGVTACAALDLQGARFVFAGAEDGKVFCLDALRGAATSVMVGHTKAVTRLWAAPGACASGSLDGSVRLWRADATGAYRWASTMHHGGGVNDFAVLPMAAPQHIVTAGVDGQLRFFDASSGACVSHAAVHAAARAPLGTCAVHPSGVLVGTGSGAAVHLWDVRDMRVDQTIATEALEGHVTATAFSANHFGLCVGTSQGAVRLYDLRNAGAGPVASLRKPAASNGRPVSRVAYDPSGSFVAAASGVVSIWKTAAAAEGEDIRAPLVTFGTHAASAGVDAGGAFAADIDWGMARAGDVWLASCSAADTAVKVYSSRHF